MLGIGRPDRHALPRITSSKNAPTTTRALLPRERVRSSDAIRRQQAADALLAIAERVAEAGIEPMSMEEIDSEVKAVRVERRRPASGR